MKFAVLLLASLVAAAPPTNETHVETLVISEELFPESFAIYTGEHDIVEIVVPLNYINFDPKNGVDRIENLTFFFVEADLKDGGSKEYKGLYVFKDNKAKLVLENGQCSTFIDSIAYFGGKDGIYKYNDKNVTATKYGSVTESVIKMDVKHTLHKKSFVYYLTDDYILYKYYDNESSKVDAVKDARDFTINFEYLYYYDGNNHIYSYDGNNVVKIEGLPANPAKIELIRTTNIVYIPQLAVIYGRLYEVFDDGMRQIQQVEFHVFPTAYAPDTITYQYYAYKKKIYKFNEKTLIKKNSIEELNTYSKDNEDQVNAIKTSKVTNQL